MEPWVVKHIPETTDEIQGQDSAVKDLKEFVANYGKDKKAALIYGPPGCGKTASVYALANELGYELIEVNASDFRSKQAIEERLGPVIKQHSLFSQGKIVLVDEIDGMSGRKDRGGTTAVLNLMKDSIFPIVMTANDPWDSKFSTLRKKSELIQFRTLAYTSVRAVLRRICEKESIKCEKQAITKLAMHAGGDLRGAVNDLQTLAEYTKKLTKDSIDEISDRKQTESMITALTKVLKTTRPEVALGAYDDVDEDVDDIFLWLEENIPKEYTKTGDLAKAFDNLSTADVYRGRIRRWQYWRYLVYIYDLLSVGIALSKDEKYKGYTKYTRTKRILKMWQANIRNAKKKSVAEKYAKATHTSANQAFKEIPYLKTIFKSNSKMAKAMAEELELDDKEVQWLKK